MVTFLKTRLQNNKNKIVSRLLGGSTSVRKTHIPNKQSGFSLIEVMISAVILSVSILGLLGMQLVGMKGTQESYMKQQAMGVVYNLTERMRANKTAVIAKNYLVSPSFSCATALPNCSTASCDQAQIAKMDLLNIICGSQIGGGAFTGGVKVTNSTDNAILSDGSVEITCAPVNLAAGIAADCATGDVVIKVGWQERAVDPDQFVEADSLEVQTRIGQ